MVYAEAKRLDAGVIPVIDIAPLRDGSDPLSVAQALHAASQGLGFIYIKGHGIPPSLTEDLRSRGLQFFNSPEALKQEVAITASHRGWLASGGAKMQDDSKPDLKESLIWGYEDRAGTRLSDHSLRGENLWPGFLPELRSPAMAYFNQAHEVAHDLLRGFALGLGLAEDFFLRSCSRPLSRASLVYYPAQPEALGADQFGVGPHTDFGLLTLLCQDSVGGLQVQDAQGEWVHASPIEGSLLVNVGDLLARWTNNAYKSTPHRVVNRSGLERLSLVVAYDPNPETLIDAREVFGADAEKAEPPITCGDYLTWRFGKAFAYRAGAKGDEGASGGE